MVDEKILRRFCRDENFGKYIMSRPFVVSGWKYYTNGAVAVRTPAPGEKDSTAGPDCEFPDAAKLFVGFPTGIDGKAWPKPSFELVEVMMECGECENRSDELVPAVDAMRIAGRYIDPKYVARIASLPAAAYHLSGDEKHPLTFRFGHDGQGMMMGMSPESFKNGILTFCVAPE